MHFAPGPQIPGDGLLQLFHLRVIGSYVEAWWVHVPMCRVVSWRLEAQYYLVRALIPLFGFTSLVMLAYIIFFGKSTTRGTYSILLSFDKKFPRVAYNDLALATGKFSELNLVGRGGYGSVYRGKLI